jgi:hypothetical protein
MATEHLPFIDFPFSTPPPGPKNPKDWPAFHHQLGVSLLASTDLPRARQSLQRAWEQRQDALTAKAMARLVDATGLENGDLWGKIIRAGTVAIFK